jgi:hypothetical protein
MKRVSYEDITLAGATSRDVSAKKLRNIRRKFVSVTPLDYFLS